MVMQRINGSKAKDLTMNIKMYLYDCITVSSLTIKGEDRDKPNYPQKMNCTCGAVYRNILIRVRTE